jgi:hypothetical protein
MTAQKRLIVLLIAGACLAALVGLWSLRRPFIDAAQADLQARKLHWFQILGTRMPCHGTFDIGVTVMFKNSAQGEMIGGRLCRFPDWSSDWKWYPDPGDARPKVR